MSSWQVPVVDIAPYVRDGSAADKARVAVEIDHACATVGFIQILGHGIPPDVITGLGEAWTPSSTSRSTRRSSTSPRGQRSTAATPHPSPSR